MGLQRDAYARISLHGFDEPSGDGQLRAPTPIWVGRLIRKLAGTAVLTTVGAVASRGIFFAGVLIFARSLGPVDYGTFSLLQMTGLLFSTFFALGLAQMATKIVAEAKAKSIKATTVAVTVSYWAGLACAAVFMVTLVALAHPLARAVSGESHDAPLYMLSSLLVLTGTIIPIQSGIALGLGAVKQQAMANIISAPLTLFAMIYASWRGGVVSALAGYIVAQAIVLIAQQIALHRSFRSLERWWDPRGPEKRDWEIVWRFGAPTSVAGMLTLPSSWLALLFLARSAGNIQVGLFSFANQFRTIMLFGIGMIATASLPQLTGYLVQGNLSNYRRLTMLLIVTLTSVMSMLSIVVWLFGDKLLSIFLPKFVAAGPVLLILAVSAIATSATSIYMRSSTAAGDAFSLIIGNIAFAVAIVPLSYFWAIKGAIGLALATLTACILQAGTFCYLERRRMRRLG